MIQTTTVNLVTTLNMPIYMYYWTPLCSCIYNVPFSSVLLLISTDDTVPKVLKRSLRLTMNHHPSNSTTTELCKSIMQTTNFDEFCNFCDTDFGEFEQYFAWNETSCDIFQDICCFNCCKILLICERKIIPTLWNMVPILNNTRWNIVSTQQYITAAERKIFYAQRSIITTRRYTVPHSDILLPLSKKRKMSPQMNSHLTLRNIFSNISLEWCLI